MLKRGSYLKALIICHGKSECILCQSLKSNLRLPIEIISDNNGTKSIQITSITKFLKRMDLKNIKQIKKNYKRINIDKKNYIKDFKIFIIMDLDEKELSEEDINNYKTKKMFKEFDYYDYIEPIYNDKNLDEVIESFGYKIDKKNKTFSYRKIFPGINGDMKSFKQIKECFSKTKKSNMIILLNYLEKCIYKYQ